MRRLCLGWTDRAQASTRGHAPSEAMDDTTRDGPGAASASGEGSEPLASPADAEEARGTSFPSKVGGAPSRGREETRDPLADDAPSPSSPRPRVAARAPARRAKTPPTFEEGVPARPSGEPASREKPPRAPHEEKQQREKKESAEATTTTMTTNPYPLSFLFPGGRLYREPPPRASSSPHRDPPDPDAFLPIPDDFERLAVDPEASQEVRRLTRVRGLRRIAEARARLRLSSKRRNSRHSSPSEPSEGEEDPSFARGAFFLRDEDDEDDEFNDDDDDDDSTLASAQPAAPGRPRMCLLSKTPASSAKAKKKRRRDAEGTVSEDDARPAGIRTPVKGFRTPRANESATVAATMAMADFSAAAKTPPKPTPFTVGSVVVLKIGTIDRNRSPRFSSASSYLLPIGFTSRRKYASVEDPERRVWYESTVEPGDVVGDGNDETTRRDASRFATPAGSPAYEQLPSPVVASPNVFRDGDGDGDGDGNGDGDGDRSVRVIVRECDPGVTHPKTFVGKSPTDAWQRAIRAVNETAKTRKRSSVSGPQFLGLSSPVVAAEIAKLPGYAQARAELEERRARRGGK